MGNDYLIRPARLSDVEALLDIYSYYVEETAITFEYDVPAPDEFKERMRKILKRYPYLLAEQKGRIMGYAYAGPFVGRAAYQWSCEVSIYIEKDARGRGLGGALYHALEKELQKMGILNLYACIAYPAAEDEYLTRNSQQFHSHLGYVTAGRFHKCGYKFGRWYDMIWMEKMIGDHH